MAMATASPAISASLGLLVVGLWRVARSCMLRFPSKVKFCDPWGWGEYEGELNNEGKRHGRGVMRWENGGVYNGEWKNDRREGQGRLELAYGDVYRGEWKNGFLAGQGSLDFANGGVYKGGFKNGLFDGQGTFKYLNGDIYVGEWRNDVREGQGTYRCANGDIYMGEIKNGCMEGQGKMRFKNRNAYEGMFVNGLMEGRGTMKFADGNFYEGEWKNGRREGQGMMKFANGNVYQGEWKNDKLEGKGKYTWVDGNVYEGEFKNDLRVGEGSMTFLNGKVHKGLWKNNKQDGLGTVKWADGRFFSGVWQNGLLVSQGSVHFTIDGNEAGSRSDDKQNDGKHVRFYSFCKNSQWGEALKAISSDVTLCDWRDEDNRAPIHWACKHNAPAEVIQKLLEKAPSSPKWKAHRNILPLHEACYNGLNKDACKILLRSYPDAIHMKDDAGKTPMECVRMANRENRDEIMDILEKELEDQKRIGRNAMLLATQPNSEPLPITFTYIEMCTDRFSSGARLGEGAFGEVYMGIDRELRRKFAIKRIRVHSTCDEEFSHSARQSFQRELSTLKQFKHPNVARLLGYCLSDDLSGPQCLIFELAANGSLNQVLKDVEKRKKLHWTTRVKIGLDVACALQYMHGGKAGYICYHGDVKSSNICLKRDYSALLIDCGVSKMIPDDESEMTMSIVRSDDRTLRGSPGYICPTYARTHRNYNDACDIYSLGIVLIELLTGNLQLSNVDGRKIDFFDLYSKDVEALKRKLDISAGRWRKNVRNEFARLAVECIADRPGDRPSIQSVVERLSALWSNAKPWSLSERNSLAVLFSDPLVWAKSDGTLHPVYPRLDFREERAALKRCFAETRKDIEIAFKSATVAHLHELLMKRCGCLHFSGHGTENYLLFEDGKGGAHFLTVDKLRNLLETYHVPFQLVFVSACHSEEIARVFLRAGVKHVVCCEHKSELRNDVAFDFTRSFYRALAEGYTIAQAFETGRGTVGALDDKEMDKFLLLPKGADHNLPIFAAGVLEWHDAMKEEQHIPDPPVHFLGREVQMHDCLYKILSHRLVTVIGDEGIGRRSLVSAVCNYIAERISGIEQVDSILFIRRDEKELDLNGPFPNHIHDNLVSGERAKRLGETKWERICDSLAGSKALVVLEDTDDAEDSLTQFLEVFFDRTRAERMLLTAQRPTKFASSVVVEKVVRLGPLDLGSSAMLFGKTCPFADTREKRNRLWDVFLDNCSKIAHVGVDTKQSINSVFRDVSSGVPSSIIHAALNMTEDDHNKLAGLE